MTNEPKMIVTQRDVEVGGRKMVMESHDPNPKWRCECGCDHPKHKFLYDAAAYVTLIERISKSGGSVEEYAEAFMLLKKSCEKAFPKPDYSKIQSLMLNGVEYGPETETFQAFYRLRNGGKNPPPAEEKQ